MLLNLICTRGNRLFRDMSATVGYTKTPNFQISMEVRTPGGLGLLPGSTNLHSCLEGGLVVGLEQERV